jgi:hypothetical protein
MWICRPTASKLSHTECATSTATNQRPGVYSSVDSGELLPGSFLHQGSLGSEGHSSSWQPPSSTASCHLGKCSFGVYIGPSFFFCRTHCDLWPCLTCYREHPFRILLQCVPFLSTRPGLKLNHRTDPQTCRWCFTSHSENLSNIWV